MTVIGSLMHCNSLSGLLVIFYVTLTAILYVGVIQRTLPEDGHNGWSKQVGVYSTVNVHICVCTGWSYLS